MSDDRIRGCDHDSHRPCRVAPDQVKDVHVGAGVSARAGCEQRAVGSKGRTVQIDHRR